MFRLLKREIVEDTVLSKELSNLFKGGLIVYNECVFLNSLFLSQKHIAQKDFIDQTAYECFINSIHVDDYITDNLFAQALLFVEKVIEEWMLLKKQNNLEIILSKTDYGFNIKFHILRTGEDYLNIENINSFEEGLMVLKIG